MNDISNDQHLVINFTPGFPMCSKCIDALNGRTVRILERFIWGYLWVEFDECYCEDGSCTKTALHERDLVAT